MLCGEAVLSFNFDFKVFSDFIDKLFYRGTDSIEVF